MKSHSRDDRAEPVPQAPFGYSRSRGVGVIRCRALSSLPGLGHAFSTRLGDDGVDFDLGGPDEGRPAADRRRALCAAAGLDGQRPHLLRQVHGDRVLHAGPAMRGGEEADGLVLLESDRPRRVAAVRTADCVPLLLADAEGRAVAAVHAGWRGTAAAVVKRAVELLAELGIPRARLIAAMGPAIGPCCYEVGEEVLGAVAEATGVRAEVIEAPGGVERKLDLRLANRLQLEDAGLAPAAIHAAPHCTACSERLFFLHRRGRSGRLMACIGWTRAAPAGPA